MKMHNAAWDQKEYIYTLTSCQQKLLDYCHNEYSFSSGKSCLSLKSCCHRKRCCLYSTVYVQKKVEKLEKVVVIERKMYKFLVQEKLAYHKLGSKV
jgi:hypothetical protein